MKSTTLMRTGFACLSAAAIITCALISCTASGVSDSDVVATVDGDPITVREFTTRLDYRHVAATHAYFASILGPSSSEKFWTTRFGDKVPVEYARKRTLRDLVSVRVQQALMKQHGIQDDIGYASFVQMLEKENARRREAVARGEVIYGPVTYREAEYFEYLFDGNVVELKKTLAREVFLISEDHLRHLYELDRKSYRIPDRTQVETAWVLRSGDAVAPEVMNRVRADLLAGIPWTTIRDRYDGEASLAETVFDESTMKGDELGRVREREEAEKLDPGGVSPVFETAERFMVMRCVERERDRYQNFDRVRGTVHQRYVDSRYDELVNGLVARAGVRINKRVCSKIYP